jgi:3-phenylpropionate/cinnamic acid dioxygenase small subunit
VRDENTVSLEAMVREARDRDQIAQLIVTYAQGIDRRDWDLVRSCFADDASVEGSRTTAPIDPYLAEMRPGVDYYPTTMHFMGNQLIEVDGDTGHIQTYAVAYHWKDEEAGKEHPENLIVGVRYRDTVERRADGWIITKRKVEPDWRRGPYPQV